MERLDQIMHVADEVRRLMRIFSDLCFDEAPQDEIDAAWRQYMHVKRLHRKEWSMSQDSENRMSVGNSLPEPCLKVDEKLDYTPHVYTLEDTLAEMIRRSSSKT